MVIDPYGYNMWCESTTENSIVRLFLKTLDPDGERLCSIHKRRRRGPIFIVHVDSYYNLLLYGFPINGAKDGFSREILWGSDF